jgi:hypothetical protein
MKLTYHFTSERLDRYAFIATTIGVGEVVHSHKQTRTKVGDAPCTVDITNTGVAVVRTPENAIVTMYILTIGEAKKYYADMPMMLEAIIRTNMRRRLHILQNNS